MDSNWSRRELLAVLAGGAIGGCGCAALKPGAHRERMTEIGALLRA